MTTTTTTTTARVTTPGPTRRRGSLAATLALTFAAGVGLAHLANDDPPPRTSTAPATSPAETINASDVHLYNQAEDIEHARRCQSPGA
jgi:hypothetical protein